MKYILPQKIQSIIAILNNAGFSAHLVGGCVRDLILNKLPHDWDITTSALPDEVKALFPAHYDTGIKHGTVTVNQQGQICEITTWRRDSVYLDHRRPESIAFTTSLTEDLARRDFTINAMAYHPEEGITDIFGGLRDIKSKTIRAVGDPDIRFSEDALRMLRAVRFSAQLDFQIENQTLSAIKSHAREISYVSRERIQSEINKILLSDHPVQLALLWETGLSDTIFPDICSLSDKWFRAATVVKPPQEPSFLLALLFFVSFQTGAPLRAKSILKSLKYDNKSMQEVDAILMACEEMKIPTLRNVRKASHEYGQQTTTNACHIQRLAEAYTSAQLNILPFATSDHSDDALKLNLSPLDLQEMGAVGRTIGAVHSSLMYCLYERPEINEKDILLIMAKIIMQAF